MDKKESLMLKGVAILIMLFGHLFGNANLIATNCHNLFYIQGIPLASWLTRAAGPVAYYLFLSGYGLMVVNRGGRDVNKYKRICKLYITYWVTMLVFVSIGSFICPDRYPGSILSIVENATGFKTTYNAEMWFLLPYVLLALLAPYLFKLFDWFKTRYILIATFVLNLCTSYIISRYGAEYLYSNRWLYNPFLVFHLMFSFILGAAAARSLYFERLKQYCASHKWLPMISYLLIALVVVFQCLINTSAGGALLMFAIVSLIVIAPKPTFAVKGLMYLGKYSTIMWMVHTYYCVYLFHDFIYSARYPIAIYALLIVVSLATAIPLQYVSNKIYKSIERK